MDAPVVREVELRAPGGADPEEYEPLLAVEAGERLSRRALRRTIQRLFETGRFANVTAYTVELAPSAVRLVIVLEPRRPILGVMLRGVVHMDEESLRRASGLSSGMELSEDRLDAASAGVREVLARHGYEQARVEARTQSAGEGGVEIRIDVDEGAPTRLARFEVAGDPGDRAIWEGAISLQTGDILDRPRISAELDRLRARYRQAGYYRARIGQPRIVPLAPGLAEVEVEIEAGPQITLELRGNRAFDDSRLRGYLAYDGEERLDPAMMADLASRLERIYRQAGYYDVRVLPAERLAPDGRSARLTFYVNEGSPLLVESLAFQGNDTLRDEELRLLVRETLEGARRSPVLLQPLDHGELDRAAGTARKGGGSRLDPYLVYDDESYERVVEELTARYRSEGFLDVKIHAPRVRIDEPRRVAQVELTIEEGRRTRIRSVDYPGAEALDPRQLLARSKGVTPGLPLSERMVDEHRLALRALYGREGYLYATVDVEVVRPSDNPTRAQLLFHVREGPQVRVGRVLVRGNARTSRVVFDENLELGEGEVLGSESLANSQQRLMRLGLFRTVTVRPLDPEVVEAVKDLVVDVNERPSLSLEVGAGISVADGPRAFSELVKRNLLGRDLQLSLRGRVNYQVFREEVLELPMDEGLERFVDLGLSYPRIYGLPIRLGVGVDLIHERDIRPAYRLTRYSALTGLDWPLSRQLNFRLAYELESNWIERSPLIDDLYSELSRADLQQLRFPNGNTLLGSVRPSVVLNLQDDPVSPHAGLFAKLETDFARNLGGDTTVDFAKVSGTLTGYIPLAARTTLVLSTSAGRVFPLRESSTTIAPKRFYLGGAGTIRGYSEDAVVPEDLRDALRQEIADCEALLFSAGCSQAARFLQKGREVPSTGGELFALARAELRFPIQGNLMGGVFVDAGNLWSDPSRLDLENLRLRSATGAGLRYATPIGPVALDVGFNLDPDPVLRESPYAIHFSIGLF